MVMNRNINLNLGDNFLIFTQGSFHCGMLWDWPYGQVIAYWTPNGTCAEDTRATESFLQFLHITILFSWIRGSIFNNKKMLIWVLVGNIIIKCAEST